MQRIQILSYDKKIITENLLSAEEGWFLEFKEKFNDSNKVSKSITSFLNSYGGYIIVGVSESKDKSTPKHKYIGLDAEQAKRQINLIKDTIKRNISPVPFVNTLSISGPITDLGLEKDREIIIIDIPEGNNPPYISQSGKIYRRKHDSSEPEEENSRYVVDELYKKSKEIEAQIQKEIQSINYIDKVENNYPLSNLNIYYFPIQYPNKFSKKLIRIEDINDVIQEFGEKHIKFENIYYEGPNIVFRILKGTPTFSRAGLIALFNRENYSFKTRIQCSESYAERFEYEEFPFFRSEYNLMSEFKECFQNEIFDSVGVVDFTEVFKLTNISFLFYKKILDHLKYSDDLKCKIMLSNLHKKIPFLNFKGFINHCKKYKLPYYISNSIEYPDGNNINSFIHLSMENEPNIEIDNDIWKDRSYAAIKSIPITIKMFDFLGFGVPSEKEISSFFF